MLNNRTSGILAALAAVAATMTPLLAPAAPQELPAVRLVYSDLNLATPAGVSKLYERIRAAAARSCAPLQETMTGTRINTGYDACVHDAVGSTVEKLAIPGLTALHAARGGADKHG